MNSPVRINQCGMAAQRDPTWYNTVSRRVKYHIISEDGCTARCGEPMMNDDAAVHPVQVPQAKRCQRSGCRQQWPKGKAKA